MAHDDNTIPIEKADVHVQVADDGIWLGFFASDGKSAVVNLDKILSALPRRSIAANAIRSWAHDRRVQAARIAG